MKSISGRRLNYPSAATSWMPWRLGVSERQVRKVPLVQAKRDSITPGNYSTRIPIYRLEGYCSSMTATRRNRTPTPPTLAFEHSPRMKKIAKRRRGSRTFFLNLYLRADSTHQDASSETTAKALQSSHSTKLDSAIGFVM